MPKTYIINKPYGTLSQFTREHPSHKVLGDHYDFPKEVYPVGRLDKDSEGLLILTNDKSLNARLLHPRNKQPKEYWVQVEGEPKPSNLIAFNNGISIKLKSGIHQCLPAKAKIIEAPQHLWERNPPIRFRKNAPTTWLSIILTEGKNRQVRKMCAKIGFPVLRLIRWRIGALTLEGLNNGEVKEIATKDLD